MRSDFEWSRRVEFSETDLAGVVHFSNFYRWMEAAEHAFLQYLGIELLAANLGWPRVHAQADFKKPITFHQVVRVKVNIQKVSHRSVTYQFEFLIDESEQVHATGEMTSACVDLQSMKSVEIPVDIRGKLSQAAQV